MTRSEPLEDLGTCPSCGGADVKAIWYGMPPPGYQDDWPANVRVGGCSITEGSPNRVCANCGHEWLTRDNDG